MLEMVYVNSRQTIASGQESWSHWSIEKAIQTLQPVFRWQVLTGIESPYRSTKAPDPFPLDKRGTKRKRKDEMKEEMNSDTE